MLLMNTCKIKYQIKNLKNKQNNNMNKYMFILIVKLRIAVITING